MADGTTGTGLSDAARGLGTAGGTSTSGLAPWVSDYITGYLGKAQALAQMPYQVYQGPLTAGTSALQNAAFQGIANLAVPQSALQSTDYLNQIAQNLGNVSYQPVGVSFTGGAIPTRANMPLQPTPVSQIDQGTLGGAVGKGTATPWTRFTQEVKTVTPGPVAPTPVGPGTSQPTPPYPTYPTTQDPKLSPTPGAPVPGTMDISKLGDLYQQYFGKTGDAEGMKYWQEKFGKDIDPTELRQFLESGLNVIQKEGGEASVALLDQLRGLGLSPAQQQNISSQAKQNVADLYKTYLGKTAEDEGSHYWASRFGKDVSNDELKQFLLSAQSVLKGQGKEVPKAITDKLAALSASTSGGGTGGGGTGGGGTGGGTGGGSSGVSQSQLDAVKQAFLSTPGANPNPDADTLKYYAEKGIDQMKKDVAAIRASNPALAAQIDAARKSAGLASGGYVQRYADGGIAGLTQQDFASQPTSSGMTGGGMTSSPYGGGFQTPTATGSSGFLQATPNIVPSQQVSGIAAQYMNPYLQTALQPQLEEQRRQAQINLQPALSKLSQAGGLGGGRQAIMESEALRNLLQQQGQTIGAGYKSAYDVAQQQFNTEQQRAIQEAQFGANYGLQAAQQQAQAAQQMGQLGLQSSAEQRAILNQALMGGQAQRDIEQQGITADYNEFLKQIQFPYQQLQYQQGMLSGLPVGSVTNTPTQLSGVAALIGAVGGVDKLLQATGQKDLMTLINNLFGGTAGGSSGTTNP